MNLKIGPLVSFTESILVIPFLHDHVMEEALSIIIQIDGPPEFPQPRPTLSFLSSWSPGLSKEILPINLRKV